MGWEHVIAGIGAAARELTLFAAVGMLIGGIDDLMVDAVYFVRRLRGRWAGERRAVLCDLPLPTRRFAIFIPAWDESAVIAAMLRNLSARLPDPSLMVFVGAYPNDGATVEAVAGVALDDPRIRLVVGHRSGPTTKADCLNSLWRALNADEAVTGMRVDAVILHDAEDVVDEGELTVFDHALSDADAAQLPVLPLPRAGAHLVGGTYLDEFAEAHAKLLAVREYVGAGLPLAGVGCAVSRAMLERIATARGGMPFDASSLTEDYELGLAIAALGGRTRLALVDATVGGGPVGVRAYFPATLEDAVRQKARWLIGIALAGWDRTGWGRARHIGEYWMRMRDRRAPLAMLVLVAAYGSLVLWAVGYALALGNPADMPPVGQPLELLLAINGLILLWRLAIRGAFVTRRYGLAEGFRALPRMLVGNIVAMMAARRALVRYVAMLRGAAPAWDKTPHEFPDLADRTA